MVYILRVHKSFDALNAENMATDPRDEATWRSGSRKPSAPARRIFSRCTARDIEQWVDGNLQARSRLQGLERSDDRFKILLPKVRPLVVVNGLVHRLRSRLEGAFLFAAGTASGRLASYRVDGETGALTPLDIYTVGQRPAAVLAVPLGR